MAQTEEEKRKQEELIAAIAVLIAMRGVPVPSLALKVGALITAAGLIATPAVVLAVVSMAMSKPIISGSVSGKTTALSVVQGKEDWFRAAYIIAATSRVQKAVRAGDTLDGAMQKENRHWLAHLDAQDRRAKAAKAADVAAGKYGKTLGWYATMDNRTTAECRDANGKNFEYLNPPGIGYPGSVHRFCRCKPGRPHRGAPMVGRVAA